MPAQMPKLLDLEDIAALYKVSRRHARDFITKQPGFPERVPGSSPRFPLWLEEELDDYINRRSSEGPMRGTL